MKQNLLLICFLLAMTVHSQKQLPNQTQLENIDFTELVINELIKDSAFVEQYKIHAFGNKYNRTRKILQWKVPVLVFIDKSFPKAAKLELTSFIKQITGINNLEVKLVKKLKDANYYIRLTDEEASGYSESHYKARTQDQIEKLVFTDIDYNIFTDRRNTFYGANFIVSESLFDKKYAIQKLKKGFLITLCQFTSSSRVNKENILHSDNFNKIDKIPNHDLNLLKLHYATLYSIDVNQVVFNQIVEHINN